jgi:hypothetical protein
MQEYPIKRTHVKAFPENITKKLEEHFEILPNEVDGFYQITYGALASMRVKMGESGKSLLVETASRTDIENEEVILDTNRRFRRYLDEVTGYSTKDRVKKAKSVE